MLISFHWTCTTLASEIDTLVPIRMQVNQSTSGDCPGLSIAFDFLIVVNRQ